MKVLITGGTGSFANAFIKKYVGEHDITVFSRDELKQHDMRHKYPNIRYELGDVRDRARVGEVVRGHDVVFHAAALKQVPSCEFYPFEAVKTNILGTEHVLDAAKNADIKVVFLSTDKAVYPINAMGISKAMAEKLAIAKGAVITRYGNVMRSRGSVIPLWEQAAKDGKPLTVTNPDMTRFLLSLDDSIDLVMYAMNTGSAGDLFVKKAPACTMQTLAEAVHSLYGVLDLYQNPIKNIGIRHGEKMHESLISAEEMARTIDMGDFYCVKPDTRDMNYNQYYYEGGKAHPEAYTSENTNRLDVTQVKELLNATRTA